MPRKNKTRPTPPGYTITTDECCLTCMFCTRMPTGPTELCTRYGYHSPGVLNGIVGDLHPVTMNGWCPRFAVRGGARRPSPWGDHNDMAVYTTWRTRPDFTI